MTSTEIVKMSSKGQLVVPEGIREEEGFHAGDRFVPFPIKDGVFFKRVSLPDLSENFSKLAKELEERLKKEKITKKTVEEAVTWARKRS